MLCITRRSAPCGGHWYSYHRAGEPYLPLRSRGRRRRNAGPTVPRSGRCTLPGNLDAPLPGCGAIAARPAGAAAVACGRLASRCARGCGAHLRAACRWPVSCLLAGYPCCMNRFLLSGPEGHPFHPLVVPLPIGAFVSSLIFDILTRTRAHGLPYLVDGAYWLIGVGLIVALVAAVFGLLDLRTIPRRAPAFATARTHLALNATAPCS
jgi:Predicted membrane protein (DUF2231)